MFYRPKKKTLKRPQNDAKTKSNWSLSNPKWPRINPKIVEKHPKIGSNWPKILLLSQCNFIGCRRYHWKLWTSVETNEQRFSWRLYHPSWRRRLLGGDVSFAQQAALLAGYCSVSLLSWHEDVPAKTAWMWRPRKAGRLLAANPRTLPFSAAKGYVLVADKLYMWFSQILRYAGETS